MREAIWEYFKSVRALPLTNMSVASEVTTDQNAGEWLSSQFSKESLRTAIDDVILSRPSTLDQAFCAPLSLVPRESMNDVWVTLDQLDFTPQAKNGCCLAL